MITRDIKIGTNKLSTIIEHHKQYLSEEASDWRKKKASIIDAEIVDITFKDVDLSCANFQYAHFEKVLFQNCNFDDSTFIDCTFDECVFSGCGFEGAFLQGTDFDDCTYDDCVFDCTKFFSGGIRRTKVPKEDGHSYPYFRFCHFAETVFYQAFPEPITFSNNVLHGCNFYNCDLTNLMMTSAYNDKRSEFYNCEFSRCKDFDPVATLPIACPEEGSFIGYKKVTIDATEPIKYPKYAIAVLQIPKDAKRSSSNGKKCRCSKAKVIRFEDLNGTKISRPSKYIFRSMHDHTFIYEVNKVVTPRGVSFDKDRYNECAAGIHFFMNRIDAANY